MRYSNEGLFRRQFDFLKRQYLQDGDRLFTDVLSRETVQEALDTIEVACECFAPVLERLGVMLADVLEVVDAHVRRARY